MGSLSLLQGISPTQESNQGLLHCRQILYQLSYEGSYMLNIFGHKFLSVDPLLLLLFLPETISQNTQNYTIWCSSQTVLSLDLFIIVLIFQIKLMDTSPLFTWNSIWKNNYSLSTWRDLCKFYSHFSISGYFNLLIIGSHTHTVTQSHNFYCEVQYWKLDQMVFFFFNLIFK